MEATPPQEPIHKKPEAQPVPTVRKSRKTAAPVELRAVQTAPEVELSASSDDDEQEATRVFGALALGVMAILLICVIAFLIAYRNAPQGL
jgi:hypothetical protein